MNPPSVVAFFAVCINAFFQTTDGHCVYNNLPFVSILATAKDDNIPAPGGAPMSAGERAAFLGQLVAWASGSARFTKMIGPSSDGCCPWDNTDCYMGPSADRPWEEVSLWVICGRDNNVGTKVYLPAGGSLQILPSPSGDDNYIDVYGHLNDKLYWYRCGADDPRNNY